MRTYTKATVAVKATKAAKAAKAQISRVIQSIGLYVAESLRLGDENGKINIDLLVEEAVEEHIPHSPAQMAGMIIDYPDAIDFGIEDAHTLTQAMYNALAGYFEDVFYQSETWRTIKQNYGINSTRSLNYRIKTTPYDFAIQDYYSPEDNQFSYNNFRQDLADLFNGQYGFILKGDSMRFDYRAENDGVYYTFNFGLGKKQGSIIAGRNGLEITMMQMVNASIPLGLSDSEIPYEEVEDFLQTVDGFDSSLVYNPTNDMGASFSIHPEYKKLPVIPVDDTLEDVVDVIISAIEGYIEEAEHLGSKAKNKLVAAYNIKSA